MPNAKRKLKNQGKLLLRRIFEFGQKLGVDVLPRHFYSEIPDIGLLRTTNQWRSPLSMQGIAKGIDHQIELVREWTSPFKNNLADLKVHANALRTSEREEGYGEIEADVLYCFVRSVRPKTIIQIGCGVSTAVCLMAARDENYTPRIVCIEPYPSEFLKEADKSGSIKLFPQKVQDVEIDLFRQISRGDLFFVDSSHTLAPAGEVDQIILEILPTICPGAYIHFHDIWFPYDYSPHVLSRDLFFYHETSLLYAFLCMNERYSLVASLSLLCHSRKDELEACFPHMSTAKFTDGIMTAPGHYPSSAYLLAEDRKV